MKPVEVPSGVAGSSGERIGRSLRLWEEPGQQLFHLALALSGRCRQQRDVIVGGDVARKHARGGRAQGALEQQVDDDGVLARHARRLDAVEGRILREAKNLDAVLEGGGEAKGSKEPARVELREMDDQGDGGRALTAGELCHLSDELGIGEARRHLDLHVSSYHDPSHDQDRARERVTH
jgi:hypothetical protein